jgi:hypothetical protein
MHDDQLRALERRLAALTPASTLDRDRLMFAAGQAASRRRLRCAHGWLAATSLACGVLVAVLATFPRSPAPGPVPAVAVHSTQNAGDDASDSEPSAGSIAARLDPQAPTNHGLLRRMTSDSAEIAYEVPPRAAPATGISLGTPQNPRSLLREYVESTHGQL